MGTGIAALCASAGCETVLLDVTAELAEKSKGNMLAGRIPMLDDSQIAARITAGSFEEHLHLAGQCDWICEAIVEDLEQKQDLFAKLDAVRKSGSIVSTNTSGILLSSIAEKMPAEFKRDIAVTHFFNPVKVMRLLEIVPGEETSDDVVESLAAFARSQLKKGVVYAKDTVNFIGNRIGCFWMLAGLHRGDAARQNGLSVERIDALMSVAFGSPSTGLYGLVDLIGLDVLNFVAINLDDNLPAHDAGRQCIKFPQAEQAMLDQGQLGRKSGGGFYRMLKNEDGSRQKQMYDTQTGSWQEIVGETVNDDARSLLFDTSDEGKLVWNMVSDTLCYAADLVPEISNDIVNVDRAMRWGFNWKAGPFEMLDQFGCNEVIEKLRAENREIPRMLAVLAKSGSSTFYTQDHQQFLGTDGELHEVPVE